MHHPTDRITHTTAVFTPVVEHWLEREIAQCVHAMKDRSDVPSHHERTLLPRSISGSSISGSSSVCCKSINKPITLLNCTSIISNINFRVVQWYIHPALSLVNLRAISDRYNH